MVLHVLIESARSDTAIHAIFTLAAWLGSTFVREDGGADDDPNPADRDARPA